MGARTGGFGRTDRLLRSQEFHEVSRTGRRVAVKPFVALIAGSEDVGSGHRLGVTVSRKVGNAVMRNRVKRCIRAWFRAGRGQLTGARDVVIIARPPAAKLGGAEIAGVLDELLSPWRGEDAV
jgi:ribonuclease P protein component